MLVWTLQTYINSQVTPNYIQECLKPPLPCFSPKKASCNCKNQCQASGLHWLRKLRATQKCKKNQCHMTCWDLLHSQIVVLKYTIICRIGTLCFIVPFSEHALSRSTRSHATCEKSKAAKAASQGATASPPWPRFFLWSSRALSTKALFVWRQRAHILAWGKYIAIRCIQLRHLNRIWRNKVSRAWKSLFRLSPSLYHCRKGMELWELASLGRGKWNLRTSLESVNSSAGNYAGCLQPKLSAEVWTSVATQRIRQQLQLLSCFSLLWQSWGRWPLHGLELNGWSSRTFGNALKTCKQNAASARFANIFRPNWVAGSFSKLNHLGLERIDPKLSPLTLKGKAMQQQFCGNSSWTLHLDSEFAISNDFKGSTDCREQEMHWNTFSKDHA